MEAHPPAWEDLPWEWGRPEPSMPPGLNAEEAWAWAMDNFPALCRPSCARRLGAMEERAPAWEDLPPRYRRPEPSMPPGLDSEQAWAWAMDNFPALCRPSCAPRHALAESSRGARGLLRRRSTWPVGVPGARRAQKPCGDPCDYHAKAQSAKDPQPPQGYASATSEGYADAPGAPLSPSPPRKRLKTQV